MTHIIWPYSNLIVVIYLLLTEFVKYGPQHFILTSDSVQDDEFNFYSCEFYFWVGVRVGHKHHEDNGEWT